MLLSKRLITEAYCWRTSTLTPRVHLSHCSRLHKHYRVQRQCHGRFSCHLTPSGTSEVPVKAPLSERPVKFEVSWQDVTSWFERAKLETKVGITQFSESDDPTEAELLVLFCKLMPRSGRCPAA